MRDHFYGVHEIDFAAEIRRLLGSKGIADCQDLGQLHTMLSSEQMRLDIGQINSVSQAFYDTDDRFLDLYGRFITGIAPKFGPIYFQNVPTIRFHFPHQEGFDYLPRFHNDIMLGHPPPEVNIWVPITESFGTNAMLIMGLDDSLRFLDEVDFTDYVAASQDPGASARFHAKSRPVTLAPGQFIGFDSRCLHATQNNTTDATRISMDTRVIRVEDFDALDRKFVGSGRMKMPFAPGHYYSSIAA